MIHFDIPWSSPEEWREANRSIARALSRHENRMSEARRLAVRIQSRLESLFPLMARLCARTCGNCQEPCCRVAKLWFNFQDLLFLHLTDYPVPEGQPLAVYEAHCRYLSEAGCTLPRLARPWICTWYVCPPQTSLMRREDRGAVRKFDQAAVEIKALRTAMEDAFIRALM